MSRTFQPFAVMLATSLPKMKRMLASDEAIGRPVVGSKLLDCSCTYDRRDSVR